MKDKEYRDADIAIKTNVVENVENIESEDTEEQQEKQELDDQQLVEGYAIVFEQPTIICTIDGINYYEVIDKNALVNCDLSDVPLKYQHNDSAMILARTRNKTLKLIPDDHGLKVIADIAKTSAGMDVYKLIQRGDLDKMSFGFSVGADSYDALTHTRRIFSIDKLWDVSIVDIPAYPQTEIHARSYFEAKVKEEERIKYNLWKKKLILRTY